MIPRHIPPASRIFILVVLFFLALGCGNDGAAESVESGITGSDPPSSEPPPPTDPIGSQFVVECDVDLGLGPKDATILDFMDREQAWHAEWDGDTLVLTRRYSCGDECSEKEVLRIADALAECPESIEVRVTLRDHGSPRDIVQVEEPQEGTLTLQDWDVTREGPILVSGRVDGSSRFVFYLDTHQDRAADRN